MAADGALAVTHADPPLRGRRGLSEGAAPAAVALVALAALWPLLVHGYPRNTDDVHYHAVYAGQFLHEFLAGSPYPRWMPGMNGGAGATTFFFYGPVAYWIVGVLALCSGARDPFVLLAMAAAAILAGSGLSAYAWLRSRVSCWPAALGAALYTVLPYHLTIDLWTRSAFAEFAAYLWTPLIFLGLEWMRAGRRAGIVLFAPAFAALAATHLVTAMLASCVAGVYALWRFRRVAAYVRAGLAAVLGIALAAAYLLPALGLRAYVHVPSVTWSNAVFLLSPEAPAGRVGLWHALDALLVVQLGAALLLCAGAARTLRGDRRAFGLGWGALGILALLGASILSAPVWSALPVLHIALFPFRLILFADLGLATVAALLLQHWLGRSGDPARIVCAGFAVLAVAGAAEALLPLARGNFAADAHRSAYLAQSDSYDFRPWGAMHLPSDAAPAAPVPATLLAVRGLASVEITGRAARQVTARVQAETPATLRLGQLFFPYWRATADGTELAVRAGDGGFVEFDVPPGDHVVSIFLGHGSLESTGSALSAVALAVWLVALVMAARGDSAAGLGHKCRPW